MSFFSVGVAIGIGIGIDYEDVSGKFLFGIWIGIAFAIDLFSMVLYMLLSLFLNENALFQLRSTSVLSILNRN